MAKYKVGQKVMYLFFDEDKVKIGEILQQGDYDTKFYEILRSSKNTSHWTHEYYIYHYSKIMELLYV